MLHPKPAITSGPRTRKRVQLKRTNSDEILHKQTNTVQKEQAENPSFNKFLTGTRRKIKKKEKAKQNPQEKSSKVEVTKSTSDKKLNSVKSKTSIANQ